MAGLQHAPGILRIGEPVRRRIARLRHLDPRSVATTLDVEEIRAVEAALECRLDDEAVAILASGVADLVADAGMDVKRVVERTRIARKRGCPPELVAIGGHPGGQEFYCIAPNRPSGEPLHIIEFATKDESLVGRPIVEWLETRLEIRRDTLLNGDEAERRLGAKLPSPAQILEFQPSLVVVEADSAPHARKVRHPSFGIGEVLSESGTGEHKKLSVRFPIGDKLLLERMLEDVDAPTDTASES